MREQSENIQTGAKQKYLLIGITVLLLIGLVYAATVYFRPAEYVQPEFDPAAKKGVPTPEESLNYSEIDAENGLKFSLASTMYQQEDGSLLIYLTNPESSQAVIACEIQNEAGDVLYKSGAIRHGEYVEKLMPQMDFGNEAMDITMYLYAFEPDTWYSMGVVTLQNTLQPW